jgi:hypothetical protein
MDSFNTTLDRYRALLSSERNRQTHPADLNLDLGKPAVAGEYKMADKTYAKLVEEFAKHTFAGMPPELRQDVLNFYKDEKVVASPELRRNLELLRATASKRN